MTYETDIQDAFNHLHPVVQNVLTSTDLGEKLRTLSQKHQLHLDKWTKLENEITMCLLGITDPEDMKKNVELHVGTTHEEAVAIANDAATTIFDPVRAELEKALAQERGTGVNIPIEQRQVLEETGITIPKAVEEAAPTTVASIVTKRLEDAAAQKGAPTLPTKEALPNNPVADSSHMRKVIANDPYREQV